jgi:iron complex outermembrane recepter protein
MKKLLLFGLLAILMLIQSYGQTFTLSGQVLDRATGESLIGATVMASDNVGAVSDFEGNYSIDLKAGEYTLTVSYVGFEPTQKTIMLVKNLFINFRLKTQILDEVSVVADVARARETPVAFTNILPAKIEEELGSQDLPMILNSTPGVYATQQGGGDGDARVNIRGFNQRNVAVMLDGIPVNDMENGWVYWSNWFGLDAVTRSIQIQRGLGASKLALPSVGGTMNILTKGLESKRQYNVKHEVDNEGKFRTSLGYTSGKLKNGWGVTLASSFKKGNGFVDQTWTEAFFYYAKVDKRMGNHLLSISAMGAPQQHGQRAYKNALATYDSTYAVGLGVDTFPKIINRGLRYNQYWGTYENYKLGAATDSLFHPGTGSYIYTAYDTIGGDQINAHYKVNQYHKPAFSIRDTWTLSEKMYVSNILYMSIGKGGGTGTKNSIKLSDLDTVSGQIYWQQFYDANINNIDQSYSDTENKASQYMIMNRNEHLWYGLLSTFSYDYSEQLNFSGGLDLRSYTGSHYRVVYDLLGGDYCVDSYNANQDTVVKRVGDRIYFDDDVTVRWGGAFGQAEFKNERFSSFVNLSYARSGFMKEDNFALPSDSARNSGWLWKTSYTAKGGANYNIDRYNNFFVNFGYLSKTRASSYIFDGYTTNFREDTENEKVKAFELGYSFHSPEFAMNINAYYTSWEDKPIGDVDVDNEHYIIPPGVDQLHKGIELDFIYKLARNLDLQGLASVGDWQFNTRYKNLPVYNSQTRARVDNEFRTFDIREIHVGDAAQSQFMGSLRYEPIKHLYFNLKYIYFDRYYADFSGISLKTEDTQGDDNKPRESWEIPSYELVDLNAGYTWVMDGYRISFRLTVLNLLDQFYISDARNNDPYIYGTPPNTYDVNAASVFVGLGRRYNASVKITF